MLNLSLVGYARQSISRTSQLGRIQNVAGETTVEEGICFEEMMRYGKERDVVQHW